jgi:hypothetical protein
MQIPVVIEPLGDGQFRAHSFPPFTAVAEGRTSEEAVSKVRSELDKEMAAGKQIVMVELQTKQPNPFMAMAGWLKDDPLYDAWQAEIREYRRQLDIAEGIDTGERS